MTLTIKEIQARNQALKEAQRAGAIPGAATSQTSAGADLAKATPATNVAIGMQGSQETVQLQAGEAETQVFDDPDPEMAEAAVAVYRDQGLRKFTRKNGTWHKAHQGFFYAKDEEDVNSLTHFDKIGKVAKYEAPKK
jgi:hypothetical protein